ncbi:fibronectin type III domain-containing protein [Cohnella sp. CFH 77786]|uniref:M4 family metallopeptidase n=1 Tax=Cohnella sp. CFH 77786 TaxID=2662265 RepID=UPI001C6083D8|nr:fibronectin type III domain-containing protein [Cohnella sp. CFH 77786]
MGKRRGKRKWKVVFGVLLVLSLVQASLAFASGNPGRSSGAGSMADRTSFSQGILSDVLATDQDVIRFAEGRTTPIASLAGTPTQSFQINKIVSGTGGKSHYFLQQTIDGIPVYGKYMQLNLNASRVVYAIQDKTSEGPETGAVDTTPDLTGEEAIAALQSDLEKDLGAKIELETKLGPVQYPKPTSELFLYPDGDRYVLAYQVRLNFMVPEFGNWTGYVDAHTGEIVYKFNTLNFAAPATGTGYGYNGTAKPIQITEYSSSNYRLEDYTDAGVVATFDINECNEQYCYTVGSNSKTFKDSNPANTYPENYYRAAVDAHDYAGKVYDFYKSNYGRESIDGNGMEVFSFVHVYYSNGDPYDNAFWSGQAMYYGDGSGSANGGFDCLACGFDVIAHELTHGVTQYDSGLEYHDQPGALNESISDIMAAVIDSDDWLIGEDTGYTLRSLENPEWYDQPAHMDDFVELPNDAAHDYGGVHINSGIPNHAAYLIATKIDAAGIGLNGRSILGKVTYAANKNYLLPTSNFEDARNGFLLSVDDLTGITESQRSVIASKVAEAWAEVGIGGSAAPIADLAVYSKTSTAVTLKWTAASGATGIKLLKSTNGGTTWTAIASIPPSASTVTLTDLTPSTAYQFKLEVTGGANAGSSNVVSVTTNAANIPISTLAVSSKTSTSVTFSWTAASGASSIKLLKSTDGGATWSSAIASIPPAATTATATGLTPNTAYKFKLYVTGGSNAGSSNVVSVTTSAANAPVSTLAVSSKTSTAVTFHWTSASGASSIKLLKSTDGGATWSTAIASIPPSASTATATGLTPNTAYKFKLYVTGGLNAGSSNVVSVTTVAASGSQISTLAVSSKTSTSVTFGWTAASGATGIKLLKSTDGGATWTSAIASIPPSATTATATGLTPNTAYKFKLYVTGGANAGSSNVVSVTTAAASGSQISTLAVSSKTSTSVTFSWTAASGATGIKLLKSTDGGATWSSAIASIPPASSIATATGLTPNTEYKFKLYVTGGTNAGSSNIVSATTNP